MTAPDPEVEACAAVLAALEPLDFSARRRVIDWATSRCLPGGTQPYDLALSMVHMAKSSVDAIREHEKATQNPTEADRRLHELIPGRLVQP